MRRPEWATGGGSALASRGAGTARPPARLEATARALLDRARAVRCAPSPDGADAGLAEALRAAGDALADAAARRDPPAPRAELVALLRQIDAAGADLARRPAARRIALLAAIREATDALRAADDLDELLTGAAEHASAACALPRCMAARVEGARWSLAAAHFADDPAAAQAYTERLRSDRPALEDWPLESEMLRRRAAVLVDVPAAEEDLLAGRDAAMPMGPYVAAPVLVGDRVVAILYAGGRAVDAIDRDALRWFADGVACLYERAALTTRLRVQRDHVRQMATSAGAVMAELCDADIELRPAMSGDQVASTATTVFVAPERRLESLLTRRELEVLALMAAGVSNAGVAEQLVIAEGTVKSHVKHILRKLRASNRAEAVARYLHQYLGDDA